MPLYADIILPLAIDQMYTYKVPDELQTEVCEGCRVEVQFGSKKIYAGVVNRVTNIEKSTHQNFKPIISVLDDGPIISKRQLALWTWMADYYMCSLGEIMLAGLPAGLKLASETIVVRNMDMEANTVLHSDDEFLVLEALEFQDELTISQVQKILNRKTVFPLINKMLNKNLILTKEELNKKYKPKVVTTVELHENYKDNISEAIKLIEKYEKQIDCLLAYIPLNKNLEYVTKATLQKKAEVGYSTIKSLLKKEIFVEKDRVVSRLGDLNIETDIEDLPKLNDEQVRALSEVRSAFNGLTTVLLHGVTGSGKTRIYMELIQDAINEGKQVLYLLPEIGLTTHFIQRLKAVFGEAVTTYHSRLNQNQRAEVFKKARTDIRIVVGPRSAVFLPFENLGLIVVDESHDYSYKQQDPAPRYNGRDVAIILGHTHNAKVILGTATPSSESYFNAKSGKYGYVTLKNRIKDLNLPELIIYPLNKLPTSEVVESFSKFLLNEIKITVESGRQCLIFRNRRGYAPVLKCGVCGWTLDCIHCDVSLTYHKTRDAMRCHYCGYTTRTSKSCPDCGNTKLELRGTGTEKLEEALRLILPQVTIDRLDADTAGGKTRLSRILRKFEAGETDVLIGTQMITKGLDFENVGLVGVILADALMYYPDFRSEERAHQILCQVAGRAGRAYDKSKVIIQTYQKEHAIFKSMNWDGQQIFMKRILNERRRFSYPPYIRFVQFQFYHKDYTTAFNYSKLFAQKFRDLSKLTILGPVPNPIKRIRSKYIMNCIVKTNKGVAHRSLLKSTFEKVYMSLAQEKWCRGIRVSINVDPS